jgi:hypothetical protein
LPDAPQWHDDVVNGIVQRFADGPRIDEPEIDRRERRHAVRIVHAAVAARRGWMTQYLCYDLRAIQTYIFRVPKLKYIVGGSALVDRFDREEVPRICGATAGCSHLFSGGGKGTISCAGDAQSDELERKLLAEAHRYGLDIRFGRAKDYSSAAHSADRLYSFVPELCQGHPCELSGLYPVPADATGGAHESIRRRVFNRSEKTYRHFEQRILRADLDLGPGLAGRPIRFLSNIERDEPEGLAGRAALGRNRWAVICMDGNDMGRQLREASRIAPDALESWIRSMSKALDACALAAACAGVAQVVRAWSKDRTNDGIDACEWEGEIIVPIRPLVVGGDDIIMLCHPAYAFDFVRAATHAWSSKSEAEATAFGKQHGLTLWPATGTSISISSGVLFCPATLPIHAAVPYGESLLASAKHRGRMHAADGKPTPSTIDWESIMESMLDTPAARRTRELTFRDMDVSVEGDAGAIVTLTQRPYLLDRFEWLHDQSSKLKGVPRSILHDVLPGLRQGRSDRSLFVKRVAKNHPRLAGLLAEGAESSAECSWTSEGNRKSTWLPDAVSILQESARHEAEEAHA